MNNIKLTRQDPRQEDKSYARGELNCDRYTVIDGRIFRISRSSGYWEVDELGTDTSMVDGDEWVAVCCSTIADAKEKLANYITEFPLESREAHWQRRLAWIRNNMRKGA